MPVNGSNAIDQITALGATEAEKVVTTDKNNKVTALEVGNNPIAAATPALQSQEVVFREANGSAAGTYTGTIQLPAGATLVDLIVQQDALWDAGTSASLKVGDTVDDDGFFTAVDLKATDLLADESVNLNGRSGGVEGAFVAGTLTHITDRRKATAALNQIIGVVTTVGTLGTAGITRLIAVYSVATAVDSTFAAT
jgi:hypothetical protein